jgi:hypothetical protein
MGKGLVLTDMKFDADADALAGLYKGSLVTRDSATLPASGVGSLFAVTGGIVLLTQLIGIVTVVIETQACNLKVEGKATGQTTVDLCANLNISAKAVGTLLGITGTAANAMFPGFAIIGQVTPILLRPGTIDIETSATNTGEIRWLARYLPLETGARIAAL